MPNKTNLLLAFIFLLWGNICKAQEDELIKDIAESFAENLPDDYDLSELTERLTYFRKHQIGLNRAQPEELKQLVFLSPLQISNLLDHLRKNGKLIDLLELQGIDGFDLETINRLVPFVMVTPPSGLAHTSKKDLISKGNNDLILRFGQILETQKGFRDLPSSRYLGTPEKLLLRYRYTYADLLSASLVAEKDAGERLFYGKTGADHLSGNVSFYKLGRIKKLVLGDFSLQFGQGLTLWSGFGFGKGPDVTSVAAKDVGLKPYSSSNEAAFFRGLSGTIRLLKHVDFSPFVSYRKLDASLKHTDSLPATLQNINISGLHRTATELKNQKSIGQLVFGGALQYLGDNLNMGIVGYQSQYQHRFVTGSQLYNKYSFTGQQLTNTGFHYNYTFKNVYCYGEAAYSLDGGWAVLNGAMASLSPKLSAVLLYRNYDRDYHSFFSNGVGEASEVSNEKGGYIGLNYLPNKRWTFSVYGDYFKFPWLKYRVDSASSGYEVLSQATYIPSKTLKILIRYKREIKQQNPDADSNYPYLQQVVKEVYRIACDWKLNKTFSFQQRTEVSHYRKSGDNELGYLVYSDVNVKPPAAKLSGNIRFAYFQTPSYNSRIYAYEDDVLYGASFGNYSGKGIRTFVNTRYPMMRKLDLWLRFGFYAYRDVTTIGSALDEINGNKKADVKLQMRYQF